MESRSSTSLFLPLLLPVLLSSCLPCHGIETREGSKKSLQVYIVYMGEKQYEDPDLVTALHHKTLSSVLGSKEAALESVVYSYKHGFSGFSAWLTDSQVDQIAGLPGVISVTESHPVRATTTRSWDFLGLSLNNPPSKLLYKAKMGEDVIIGVIDTGVWPESKSFRDKGLGPIPSRWKGTCVPGVDFNASHCNRKLIGARYYDKTTSLEASNLEYQSARDAQGHGTHTASTAAGSFVRGASFHGLAIGWARGGAPRARVAVYKALGSNGGGDDATVTKAIDDAIHDGVDVLSLSLGSTVPGSRPSVAQSWATLHAVHRGITVVYSASNDGPLQETVGNSFPWVITVAASTMDRSFPTSITLGDNRTITGQATYYKTKNGEDKFKELYYDYSNCNDLNATEVFGKIVICNTVGLALTAMRGPVLKVMAAGGAGVILARYSTTLPETFPDFPVAAVDLESREQILQYVFRTGRPVAKISPTRTVPSDSFNPRIAAFSSRGPSTVFPALLKPDVAAPGVRILAAVKDGYEFMEGTSMACPHVSGIVALLKSLHPSWSPAAIKSAIVTTASIVDKNGLPIMAEGTPRKIADPFDFGGGNIDPEKAADPGLIYDINPSDYLKYKCMWDGEGKACRRPQRDMYHLNLPSIAIPNLKSSVTVSRTVTNVGAAKSTYKAIVESPPGIDMEVTPSVLEFDSETSVRKSFQIKFIATHKMQGAYLFGSLTWVDGVHSVRIPIAIRTVIRDLNADILGGAYMFGRLTWVDEVHNIRISIGVRTVIRDLYVDRHY
ncbi:hypothetical protein Taro_032877, partial [Colocasia esculenta]|nr:hypothetical protein [Colocasia esculenta]